MEVASQHWTDWTTGLTGLTGLTGQLRQLRSIERFRTLKAKCWIGLDGLDGWLSYTAVTPRASL